MEGIIRIKPIPETCSDCSMHSYALGCRYKKKKYEGYKAARPDWYPIISNTFCGWKLEIEKEEMYGEN